MSARFEELDWRQTPMGAISLRRRRDPGSGEDVYEVKLDDDFLMSSLFTVAEVEVARLALAELSGDGPRRGRRRPRARLHRADRAARIRTSRSLLVVEALGEVIDWHERGLIPVGATLDRLIHAAGWSTGTSSPWSRVPGSTRRLPAGASTPSSSTSTTRRATCCIPSHAAFYEPAGSAPPRRSPCARAESSHCGPTTRRTRRTRRCSAEVFAQVSARGRQLPQPAAGSRRDQHCVHRPVGPCTSPGRPVYVAR